MSFLEEEEEAEVVNQQAAPSSQTQFIREAPGIEERKLELMDMARQVAQNSYNFTSISNSGTRCFRTTRNDFSRTNWHWCRNCSARY